MNECDWININQRVYLLLTTGSMEVIECTDLFANLSFQRERFIFLNLFFGFFAYVFLSGDFGKYISLS